MPDRVIGLDSIPWGRLLHVHGRAEDTPVHLWALLSNDPDALRNAFAYLHSVILRQGAPCLATAPCAAILVNGWLAGHFDSATETRMHVLRFLLLITEVPLLWGNDLTRLWELALIDADEMQGGDENEVEPHLPGDRASNEILYARSVLGCLDVMPRLRLVMERSLDGHDPYMRVIAGCGLANIVRLPEYLPCADTVAACIRNRADVAIDSDERAAHVLTLGNLGADVAEYLDDPAASRCACARHWRPAMAPF